MFQISGLDVQMLHGSPHLRPKVYKVVNLQQKIVTYSRINLLMLHEIKRDSKINPLLLQIVNFHKAKTFFTAVKVLHNIQVLIATG